MKKLIIKDEQIEIEIPDIEDNDNGVNVKCSTTRMLKHLYRYGKITTTKVELSNVLIMALKGCDCDKDHLDTSQRLSLYHYLKDKDIDDPYINQFLKETQEHFPSGVIV